MARKFNKKRFVQRKKKRVARKGGKKSFVNALRKLSKLHPSQRVAAMKMANDKFVRQFCTKVKLLRRANLSPKVQRVVRSRAKSLRKLVSPKTSVKVKRRMLTQRGGFIGALLGPLLGLGISAIGSVLRK